MKRILWNRRPTVPTDGGDIDEIVMTGVDVHIEQMGELSWWIGITGADGCYWAGNFTWNRGRMTFWQQDNDGVEWDRDDTHEPTERREATS